MFSKPSFVLLASLLGPLATGCVVENAGPDQQDRAQAISDAIAPGAGEEAGGAALDKPCDSYPVTLAPKPGAQQAAQSVLTTIAPNANMTWASARGTANAITGLTLPFACAPGELLGPQVLALLEAHPNLFQVTASEWIVSNIPCETVGTGSKIVQLLRGSYAGLNSSDSMALIVGRAGSKVELELRAMVGSYLPPPSDDFVGILEKCPDLKEKPATEAAMKYDYPFSMYQYCNWTGDAHYDPEPGDQLTFGSYSWNWQEQGTQVTLHKRIGATLLVAPANHSDKLIASDANCPWGTIGFDLRYDAVTGVIEETDPGIGPCIVCATQ